MGPRRRREKRVKNVFYEIMSENFQNLMKKTDIQVHRKHRESQTRGT